MDTQEKSKVVPIYIEDEMKTSYLDYAMSVIVGRALPDVRDGLKPVHRRILYAMQDLGLASNRAYKKSARVVGEVLGKYHPHGDTAVYDSMVRMAQDFSCRYPLIDGQGNFGSVDGDAAAAMRYTEVRMSPLSEALLADIEMETVNFAPNFDGTLQEPKLLPARIPNLLVNGTSGIAVGVATNIPTHNLSEVIDGVVKLIDKPEVSIDELGKIITGPDFPTGGIIFGKSGIKDAYATGKGQIKLWGRASIDEIEGGKERIIVTEIPYQVNKANLLMDIASLMKEKKIEGISALRDESDKDGMRIVIELRRGENGEIVLNKLYKYTQMQAFISVNMLAVHNGRPLLLNLKECLEFYLEHRQEVVRRRTQYELKKSEERAHLLEGLRIALDNLDAVIKVIKESAVVDEAREKLILKFRLTSEQAQTILDMKLQRLTGLERQKINDEYIELVKKIARLQGILASPRQILDIIKNELLEVKKKYGDKRRTEIREERADFSIEDLIAEEDMVITISHAGYVKRLPVSTYRQQQRGGTGVIGVVTKEEDFITGLFIASTHDNLLFFTDKGRVHRLKVYELPQAGRVSKGMAVVNLLKLNPDEKVTALLPIRNFDEGRFIVMVTEQAVIKRVNLALYGRIRTGGIIAINLDDGDHLVNVKLTSGNEEFFIATASGKAIRFPEEEVRVVGRTARGVRGIRLGADDRVIDMEVTSGEGTVLSVTENGYGKRSLFSEYRKQHRGGKGLININTSERNGRVIGTERVSSDDEVILISSQGKAIRIPTPRRILSRNTRGVRLIKIQPNDRVVGVVRVIKEEENKGNGQKKSSNNSKTRSEKL
jgi:DNA gyrase subunit A